ncbi:uncharacterized protein METZ01_LOCUS260874, partial [marine metagenome]
MNYLAETDVTAAMAKAKAERLKVYGKTVKAFGFLGARGTVAEREAHSLTTPEYESYLTDLEQAILDSEKLANERATAAGVREVWRSTQF